MTTITLTFDNGPEPDVTPEVLNTLANREIPATFFVLGHKIADPERLELAERAKAEGHWIGNHTYTHETPLGRMTGDRVAEDEIAQTQRLIAGLSHPDKFFRPFGGQGALGSHLLNRQAANHLQTGDYTCVLWNVIPRDWAPELAEGWVDRAMEMIKPLTWALVVLHDLPTGSMNELDRFIGTARDAGHEFRQEFPPECLPIIRGQAGPDLNKFVSDFG